MNLSDGEKIIISMLADIKNHFEIEGEIDQKRVMQSIWSGNLWSLKWDMGGLLHDANNTEELAKETADYLDMWEFIEEAYDMLNDEDKERVRAAYGRAPAFPGFDGNNENHYGVACHFVNDMERFTRFQNRNLNSHHQVVGSYQRMYEVFEPLRNKLGDRHPIALNADEIIQILTTRAA